MTSQFEAQLIERCAGYIHELAEIYRSGGTDPRYILKDLREIERRVWHAVPVKPSLRPATVRQIASIRWVDDIRQALIELGGRAHLSNIERTVRKLRREGGRSWPKNAAACIRYSLETHCAESLNYRGGPGLFDMVSRGSGYWRLRSST